MWLYACRRLRSTGFTLIELLITITILVVLTVVAVPSMNRMIHRNRIIATANEIVTAAKFAQNEAIIRKERIIMEMDPDDSHHWVIYIAPRYESTASIDMPAHAERVRELWLDKSLELVFDQTSFGADKKKIQFLPNGTISRLRVQSENEALGVRMQGRGDFAAAVAVCSQSFPKETIDVRLGGVLGDVGGRTVNTIRRKDGQGTDDCSVPKKANWQ